MFRFSFKFLCSFIDELNPKKENKKISCCFTFGSQCTYLKPTVCGKIIIAFYYNIQPFIRINVGMLNVIFITGIYYTQITESFSVFILSLKALVK